MKNNFTVSYISDLDYEEMVADICFNNLTVAMLTYEKGIESFEILIFPPPSNEEFWKLNLNVLLEVIEEAKNRLILMRE